MLLDKGRLVECDDPRVLRRNPESRFAKLCSEANIVKDDEIENLAKL
jgi:ABC-type multidrug transport system fused ATPase/permease subunit